MVAKETAQLQNAARKHTLDNALSPRVASTGLTKTRGKQSKAHQRTTTQRTTTTRTKRTDKVKRENQTSKGTKPNAKHNAHTNRKKTLAPPQKSLPREARPKGGEKLDRPPLPSKLATSEPSFEDENRNDASSASSPKVVGAQDMIREESTNASGPPQSSTSATCTSLAVPTPSTENNGVNFASTLLGEVVDSCAEDIGIIKAIINNLSPKAIVTDGENSAPNKEPLPETFVHVPIVNKSVSYTHKRSHTLPAQVSRTRHGIYMGTVLQTVLSKATNSLDSDAYTHLFYLH